ncbi:MAG: DUF4367 domain-containing protein [Enterocloster asparagiformis]|nr:DUF4367 domain-containing protein [Enterocloster asparagiformis]
MENKRKGLIEDNEIDHLLQQLYGFSDEQLLRDFKEMEEDKTPRPDLEPFPDEFDRIWEDIQAERAARFAEEEKGGISEEAATVAPKPRRKKRSWKRLAVVGLAACFLTLGCCFVAVGKKSYFYRERERSGIKHDIVYNNDAFDEKINSEELVYARVEEELGIPALKLGYIPAGMKYSGSRIEAGGATIEFEYNGQKLYLLYSKDENEASRNYKSDVGGSRYIKNKWLNRELEVSEETLQSGETNFEVQFINEGVVYSFWGIMPEKEFDKIVERLIF